jgi:hypothetical protein
MVNSLKRLFSAEDTHPKKRVYMAEPSILYHTRTERTCKSYLKEYFEADKVCTPLDFRNKDRTFFEQLMRESAAVIGITIEDVYTYSVWQDLEHALHIGKPSFTLRVAKTGGKDLDLYLIEGMTDFEKLDWEETKLFYLEIQRKELGVPMLFPRRSEY